MKEFWSKRIKCPLCATEFKHVSIFSDAVRIESRETDLKPNFSGVNPLFYSLITCSNCYYTAFEDDFDKLLLNLNPDKILKLKRILTIAKKRFKINLSENRDIDDAIKIHSLAIITYTIADMKNKLAEIYLRLAWFYRDKGNKENELIALSKALISLEEVYEKGNQKNEDRVIYLIGELYLRLGKVDKARSWFSKLIENKSFKNSVYFKMAMDRLADR